MDTVDIQEIKKEIDKLKSEIEQLKSENSKLSKLEAEKTESLPDIFEEYKDELDKSETAIIKLMDKIFDENKNKVSALAVCISTARTASGISRGVSTACWKDIEELSEEGFAAACEVFTNPRRLAILKALAKGKLTASEIGQKTGLVGGQLYHHLASLENSEFIQKVDDKYANISYAEQLLIALYACLGGMKIAKP